MKWMKVAGVVALGSASAFAAESVEREANTSSSPSVEIEVDSGYLKVETWDKNMVRLEGELDDSVEEWQFNASQDAVDIVIEDERRKGRWGGGDWDGDWSSRSDTDLTLYIPVNAKLAFEGVNTSMEVSGLAGSLEAETVNGSIEASDITAPTDLSSVNGEIKITDVTAELEVDTVNGEITIRNATGSTLDVSAVNGDVMIESTATHVEVEAVAGDIEAMLAEVERMSVSLVSGDLETTMQLVDGARLTADAVSGDLEISLIDPINIRVEAESMSGDLDNEITDAEADSERFFGKNLAFTTGDASARIEVNTVSGDLTLKRAND